MLENEIKKKKDSRSHGLEFGFVSCFLDAEFMILITVERCCTYLRLYLDTDL